MKSDSDAVSEFERLESLYRAFNAREIDAVLEQLDEAVDWPNAWEGGRVHGRGAVREYWTRQWSAIDPEVEPTAYTTRADGSVEVRVRQTVRDLRAPFSTSARCDTFTPSATG